MMRWKSVFAAAIAAISLAARAAPALAQSAPAPALQILTAARILDVETGRLLTGQAVLIEGERIKEIGPRARLAASGAPVLDLGDVTLLPGLSDAHVHLTSSAEVHGLRRLTVSIPRETITGVANARTTLMAGFTTVRNVGTGAFADVALRDAIADGEIPGPRIIPAGYAIGITGGHCDSNLLPEQYREREGGVADGPWAVREAVRRNVKYGAEVIKFCATGGVLSKGTKIGAQQFTLEEMQAIVDEAHLLGLKVAAHAHGTDGIRTALEAGVDSIEHSSFIDTAGIELAKAKGAFLSMDIYNTDYILSEGEKVGILPESLEKERQVGRRQRESFRAAVKAGARVVFGSDAGVYPHGDNARQFAVMVEWGMTPLQAIQAATIMNAKLFGREADIGAIAPGRYADIIAVPGNPLDDIRRMEAINFVMKGGVVYRGANAPSSN